MKKSVFTTVMAAVFAVLAMTPAAFAGNLDQTAAPTDPASAMFTLEDIYQRLLNGTAGTKRTSFAGPTTGPISGTGHTLDEVMGKAPVIDAGGASPADVLSGKTFWGLKSGSWGVQTGTGTIATVPAPVPKTGQTGCWDTSDVAIACTGTGQDGEKLKGVALPSPRFTAANGAVTDNLTGLVWLQNTNCTATVGGITPTAGKLTWHNALKWSAGLASGACGLSDGSTAGQWRLPNLRELQSLIDYQNLGPALPTGHPFLNVQFYYWSATTLVSVPPYRAWYVVLSDGSARYDDKWMTNLVLPVR